MKVLICKSGEPLEVNDSYGLRLIEQGKAVVIPEDAEEAEPETPTEPTAETEPVSTEETPAADAPKTRGQGGRKK